MLTSRLSTGPVWHVTEPCLRVPKAWSESLVPLLGPIVRRFEGLTHRIACPSAKGRGPDSDWTVPTAVHFLGGYTDNAHQLGGRIHLAGEHAGDRSKRCRAEQLCSAHQNTATAGAVTGGMMGSAQGIMASPGQFRGRVGCEKENMTPK